MTEQEYQRIKDAVARAVDRDSAERGAVLLACLQDDPELLATAEQWLAAYDGSPIRNWLETQRRGSTTAGREPGRADAIAINGAVAPVADTQPATWGGFILLEELGRGGFGVVYRAHERALRREVALKVIDASAHAAHRESIRLEGQMLARIDHPNIVKVYGIHPHGDQLAIAMEYVRGNTLAEIVSSDGAFSARDAALTAATICDALVAVHAGGLLHRDIKASNVMRAADGRIVLMDFGAGRDRYRPHEPHSDIVGTPIYMAPEVLAGAMATPASDVFSLGVLIYFLLTGAYPQAPTAGTMEPRPAIVWTGRALHHVPETLARLVERMLSPDPADRPRMGASLKKELIRAVPRPPKPVSIQSNGSSTARPAVGWQQVVRWAASGLLLCGAIGVLSTAEYNAVLGRHGAFRAEPPLVYLQTGLRSLVTPIAVTCLLAVMAAALTLTWKLCGVLVPGLARRLRDAGARVLAALDANALLTRSTVLQAAGILGLLAFLGVLWTYQGMVAALTASIDDGPREVFGALHSDLEDPGSFRTLLHLVLLAMLLALYGARRFREDASSRISAAGVIGVCALVAFVMAASYRVMQTPKMRIVLYGGDSCYVLAEQPREWLLHCPKRPPPRNRIVAVDDPKVQLTGETGVPFDAYPLVAGYVPVPKSD